MPSQDFKAGGHSHFHSSSSSSNFISRKIAAQVLLNTSIIIPFVDTPEFQRLGGPRSPFIAPHRFTASPLPAPSVTAHGGPPPPFRSGLF